MITVTICVGSSCSVRGSDEFADALERLIQKAGLEDRVRLVGAFCMEQCSKGISVKVGDQQYREIHFLEAESFFEKEILPRLEREKKP
ncbi:MAG: (2Fe-2S) ferredoxin domain-containing protein [Chloroflexi bacterium]|nr:(2Fe-2S) ferredoxin domain-containing protein [Chloroflexota bacterium]